jgi:carnosine N-methyltransferase
MVAGEFISVYHDQLAQWNAVVTCFFLDTGNNILDYIEHIHKILRKGGVWLNLGPLEYHYSKIMTETSVELSWEEIR